MYKFVLTAPNTRFPAERHWYMQLNITDNAACTKLRKEGRWNGDETYLKAHGIEIVLVNRFGGYFVPTAKHKTYASKESVTCSFPS